MRFRKKRNNFKRYQTEKRPVEKGRFYNLKCRMRKIKIFITIILLYEFAILTILQVPNYCIGFFNANFCSIPFRYFLMAVVVPVLITLLAWWMPEISRPFCKKCECETHEPEHQANDFRDQISGQVLERALATALITGVENFLSKRPKTKKALNDILKGVVSKNK